MATREQITKERLDALLSMLQDDGVKPPGEINPDHIRAIEGRNNLGGPMEVAKAHKNGESPP